MRRVLVATVFLTLILPVFASAASCPNITRNLSFGSRGSDVTQLQQFLISQKLLAAGNNTGYFGRLTESAVKKFQCRENIVCSGSPSATGYGAVGPRTRAAIAVLCRAGAAPPVPSAPTTPPGNVAPPVGTVPPNSPLVPSNCTPLAPQTQTLSCPSGQTGSIIQTRTSTCTSGATSPTWDNWTTTSNTCHQPSITFTSTIIALVDNKGWLGFGFNQDLLDRNSQGQDTATWDPAHWNMMNARVRALHPALVRINFSRDWFNPSGIVGTYDWDSAAMRSAHSIFDLYRTLQIPIMTGLWHANLNNTDDPNFYNSAAFVQLQTDLLKHLHEKGYTVNFYTPTNEPLGQSGITFDIWSTMLRALNASLTQAGLPRTMLTGADSWDPWTAWTAQWNSAYVGSYDHHYYLNSGQSEASAGLLEGNLKKTLADVHIHDTTKQVLLAEIGAASASDGTADYWYTKTNPEIRLDSYEYGLAILDMGIQAARAGESGALAWCMDGFDQGKDCGMWNTSGANGGTTLRPWFYTWSMLMKYFPAQTSEIYTMQQPDKVHILGAKIHSSDATRAHFSYAIVNRGTENVAITFSTAPYHWRNGDFDIYTYSPSNHGDGTSLSLQPTTIRVTDLASSDLTVIVPANSGVVVTSLNHAPLSSQ